jgi:hypothetical protein
MKTWKIVLFLFWALAPSILKAQQSEVAVSSFIYQAKHNLSIQNMESYFRAISGKS